MRLRRVLLAVVSAVALVVAGCGVTAGPAPAGPPTVGPVPSGPHVAIDRTIIDLGRQPFDKNVTATFKVTNTGTQPLTLRVPPVVRAEQGC